MKTIVTVHEDGWTFTDEFPGCAGSVQPEDGELAILSSDAGVEATYPQGEWVSFTTTAE